MFKLDPKKLTDCDVAVIGGGVAGVSAAVTAARQGASVTLLESDNCLGGILTESTVAYIMDKGGKSGIVKELYDFLHEHDMCCPRFGDRRDETGHNRKGDLLDVEGAKYFFDKICTEAGVRVLFHSRAIAAEQDETGITSLLLSTDCGLYTLKATVYIDASGNGDIADMVGCEWECGEPGTGRVQPASIGGVVSGFDESYNGVEGEATKTAYGNMLREHGIITSSGQASVVKLPQASGVWGMDVNFQYDVHPDDIEGLSRATIEGRKEEFDVVEAHKKIPGYEKLSLLYTSSHIGCRDTRRIHGVYRLTNDDILNGRRFEDAICLVHAHVDVHKLTNDDTLDLSRGVKSQPYHIPYRCLLPLGCKNLLLAGKCISGDFYPQTSYRMMGNMASTGEAAGFAAAECVAKNITPIEVDGKAVSAFMVQSGHIL